MFMFPRSRKLVKGWLVDRLALHLDGYTWYRHRLVRSLLSPGPFRFLNIGPGGGIETLALLRLGYDVTTIEIDENVSRRTRLRVERNGYGERHTPYVGHVATASVEGRFDGILMCEVLEHIEDDCGALEKVSDWLRPGGVLLLSTPTASFGRLPGAKLSDREDGGHVRVGYDGPDLDEILLQTGLRTVRRIYNCYVLGQYLHRFERFLYARRRLRLIPHAFSIASRGLYPLLDQLSVQPYDQITMAVKLQNETAAMPNERTGVRRAVTPNET